MDSAERLWARSEINCRRPGLAEISEAGLGVGINYELQMRQELNVCHGRMPKADVAKINNLYFLLTVQSTKKHWRIFWHASEISPLRDQWVWGSGHPQSHFWKG